MTFSIKNKSILITGAAMGMGKSYALKAAQEGARVIHLWDVNEEALRSSAEAVRQSATHAQVGVNTCVIDLSDREAIEEQCQALLEQYPAGVDVLINNAGIVPDNRYFWQHDNSRATTLCMDINTLAPMYLTRALLPAMVADSSSDKRILNVASAAGTVANPRMAVYCGSKWGLLGWSDSVRLELEDAGHNHVKITTFCPSYISTGMFDGAKSMLLTPIMTPDAAVDAAWQAMQAGKPLLYKPWSVRLGMIARALLPVRLWDWLAKHAFKIYGSMDDFRGRQGK